MMMMCLVAFIIFSTAASETILLSNLRNKWGDYPGSQVQLCVVEQKANPWKLERGQYNAMPEPIVRKFVTVKGNVETTEQHDFHELSVKAKSIAGVAFGYGYAWGTKSISQYSSSETEEIAIKIPACCVYGNARRTSLAEQYFCAKPKQRHGPANSRRVYCESRALETLHESSDYFRPFSIEELEGMGSGRSYCVKYLHDLNREATDIWTPLKALYAKLNIRLWTSAFN